MRLLRRISSERGSALPVVVGVMLIMGILVSVIHQTSNRVAATTTKERAEKRAFQAAEAGLHVAKYRLNKMLPEPEQCLTTQPVDPGAGTPCPATAWQSVGNDASYRYTVTRPLANGASECDLPNTVDDDYYYRCITSIGSAGSQTRRVQAVVQIPANAGMFPVEGIFALGLLDARMNVSVNGELGSNTRVQIGSYDSPAPGVVLAPGGTRSPSSLPVEYLDEPFPGKVWDARFSASQTTNNNANWPTGGGRFTLNSQWRELSAGSTIGTASAPLTIPAGTYNFCNVQMNNEVYLRPLGPVKIYIDSPTRVGSGCRTNNSGGTANGSFVANNGFVFKSSPADAAMIHIEMYGGPGTQFLMKNNFEYVGTLYAPNSAIEFQNNATITGAMVGRTVSIHNNFTLVGDVPDGLVGEDLVYSSGAWIECVRTPSGSDDGSGC